MAIVQIYQEYQLMVPQNSTKLRKFYLPAKAAAAVRIVRGRKKAPAQGPGQSSALVEIFA
ncbi:hypothetical protein A9165_10080 [Alishewanella sp. HH-ZS]|nr:hypothetical protein A9165_10080 [Alishewanella sp. HH-ZS]